MLLSAQNRGAKEPYPNPTQNASDKGKHGGDSEDAFWKEEKTCCRSD